MARGGKRGKGGDRPSGSPSFAGVYEGPEVLTALLAQAGSPYDAEEVAERFALARAEGDDRSEAIPALFEEEPRFPSPDEARRLSANLFGLWDRVAAGLGAADDAPEVAQPRRAPAAAPDRGSLAGDRLTPEFVEAMWKHVASLPEREARRLRDRFQNVQPDLAGWLDAVELPDAGARRGCATSGASSAAPRPAATRSQRPNRFE